MSDAQAVSTLRPIERHVLHPDMPTTGDNHNSLRSQTGHFPPSPTQEKASITVNVLLAFLLAYFFMP